MIDFSVLPVKAEVSCVVFLVLDDSGVFESNCMPVTRYPSFCLPGREKNRSLIYDIVSRLTVMS